ncbi:MAG: MFS transporter [Elusimicrobia bacterium]|nr:MFS transporter [Elusimicrobiota bacterium]MDA8242611.1 MFS transporter [Elusimicrobiota bacterium]
MNDAKYARRVLALIFALSLFNYIDRQVLYAVFPLIKTDLRLSDAQLGFLASSFMIVYMCVAPFVGYLGDRLRRPAIIGLSAVLWSVSTLFSGLVRTYAQLAVTRSAVGVGEAGYGTVSPSFLAEWFPEARRARVMALYALAIPAGSAVGYLLGGYLGQRFGWREAFYIVAVPGLLLGLASLALKETPEKTSRAVHVPLSGYKALFANRTFMLVCLAQSIGTFTVGGLAAWMPSYFVRTFGVSVARAGFLFGAVTVAAGLAGNFAGGWAADWLRPRTRRAYFVVGYASFFLSVPFGAAAILSGDLRSCLALMFLAEFFIFAYSGPYHAAIVETVPSGMRSMAFAVDIFIIHALGDAVSPFLLGLVSDAAGLPLAVFLAMLYLVLGGVVSIAAGEAYKKDFNR